MGTLLGLLGLRLHPFEAFPAQEDRVHFALPRLRLYSYHGGLKGRSPLMRLPSPRDPGLPASFRSDGVSCATPPTWRLSSIRTSVEDTACVTISINSC